MYTPGARSQALWRTACTLIPGGVNSPVRAFKGVGGQPLFVERGYGCCVQDVDGKEYIDYVMSWGPLILGHAYPRVVEAIRQTCEKGTSFGMPTELENRLASRIVQCVPSIQKVRMVSSGTEAAMSAIRLARGFTGRDLIVKFDGCYHGHSDGLLAAAGSGLATFAIPDTKGVPAKHAEGTLVVPYNNCDAVEAVFAKHGDKIAGIIVEPIAGNVGVIAPASGFLAFLGDITQRHGSLLIFDEVITGFRVGLGGAQGLYGVTPDITVLGKIIGGGMPAAAYGARAEIMDCLAPVGAVYQAGTLSGNPVAMAAGLATVETLIEDPPYARLDASAALLETGLRDAAREAGIPVRQNRVGSMQTLFFTDSPVTDYPTAKKSDARRYAAFFHGMLEQGVYLAPSQFEAGFVSTAHSDAHIQRTIAAARKVMTGLKSV
ncbi:MAG: glutamate-1-semialdehyde-2,1-aminomutase [Lentisphaerae bacterium RIFOXYB12_FULL_65_16]|nr:MAG: glutamate-1-semialdehyde-2,1-aminomutase [Lentisphaerae bacterium RIFOXYA12_64_32]OGV88828.1 MAG: glutamate-1-semialdehyde-2,1-aminomutase [Lentisphaerae bacterium RIFOXYB12_FULL_65_16]